MTEEKRRQSTEGPWLALDTSTASMTVAVIAGSRLLGERNARAERNHSMYLLPQIHELLDELQLRPADLGGFAVGKGPGSYTGVRIGITVAKTMAWALAQPVIGVSSLEAMALGAADALAQADRKPVCRWIVPLMDARRGQAYTALFASAEQRWTRIGEDGIRLMDNWVEELAKAAGPNASSAESAAEPSAEQATSAINKPAFHHDAPAEAIHAAGMSAERLGAGAAVDEEVETFGDQALAAQWPREIWFVGDVAPFTEAIDHFAQIWEGKSGAYPHPIHAFDVGRLAMRKNAAGIREDVHRLVPNYTQLAEAEAKLLAAKAAGKRGGDNRPI